MRRLPIRQLPKAWTFARMLQKWRFFQVACGEFGGFARLREAQSPPPLAQGASPLLTRSLIPSDAKRFVHLEECLVASMAEQNDRADRMESRKKMRSG